MSNVVQYAVTLAHIVLLKLIYTVLVAVLKCKALARRMVHRWRLWRTYRRYSRLVRNTALDVARRYQNDMRKSYREL